MCVLQVKRATESLLEIVKNLPDELTKTILSEVSRRIHDPSEGFFIGERNIRGIEDIVKKELAKRDADQKEKSDIEERFSSLTEEMKTNIKTQVTQDFKESDTIHDKKIEGIEQVIIL